PFPLKRRRLVLGAAGALAGAALAPASVAALPDDGRARLPAPKPLDVGIRRPNGTLLRVFTPGPTTVTLPYSGTRLLGPNYDSAMFTDFAGVTALAYLVGTATDS